MAYKCPTCKAAGCMEFRPFCSKRCADLDLGKWFAGEYTLPSEEPVDPEELERLAQTDLK